VETLWREFDPDGSGEIVYHELVAVLQPLLAPANPTTSALDPNNKEGGQYNRYRPTGDIKLGEHRSRRDDPKHSQELAMNQRVANSHFHGALRNDGVEANAKWAPKQRAIGKLYGRGSASGQDSVWSGLLEAMTSLSLMRVVDVLRSWDTDDSGSISFKEFSAALTTLGLGGEGEGGSGEEDEEARIVFNELDLNADGVIDYEELRAFLKPYLEKGSGRPAAQPAPGPAARNKRQVPVQAPSVERLVGRLVEHASK